MIGGSLRASRSTSLRTSLLLGVSTMALASGRPADGAWRAAQHHRGRAASDSEPKYATKAARGIAANRRAEIFLDL